MSLIFVYGTLKRGEPRNHMLDDQKFVRESKTLPRYRMFDVNRFPGLVDAEDGLEIEGEIWDVNEKCLQYLDMIEGCASGFYVRKNILLQPRQYLGLIPLDLEGPVECYFYQGETDSLVDCGVRW